MKLFLNIVKNWKTSLAALIVLAATYGPTVFPRYADAFGETYKLAVALGFLAARDVAVHTEDHQGDPPR